MRHHRGIVEGGHNSPLVFRALRAHVLYACVHVLAPWAVKLLVDTSRAMQSGAENNEILAVLLDDLDSGVAARKFGILGVANGV